MEREFIVFYCFNTGMGIGFKYRTVFHNVTNLCPVTAAKLINDQTLIAITGITRQELD